VIMTSRHAFVRLLPVLCLSLLLVGSADAQGRRKKKGDVPRNHPSTCPYTAGDPELLAKAGIVSIGGFEFSKTDTAGDDQYMVGSDIRWVETEHFELGFALGSYKVNQKEKEKLRGELTELSRHWETVKPKMKVLDPWTRAYLFALRCEQAWDAFIELIPYEESDFPDGKTQWMLGQEPYMGEGPFLGQKGKYEVIVFPSAGSLQTFLKWQFGLLVKKGQRYNVFERDTLIFCAQTEEGGLKVDSALHGNIVFNLTHNFIHGFQHYSYESPVWIHEGLAHWMERRIDPNYNTFDSAEGAVAEMTRKANWEPPTRKLVQSEKAPRMAQLLSMRDYAELKLEHHFTTWSMVDYLQQEHPGFIGRLLDAVKGIKNEQGIGDSGPMLDRHREAFKKELGMNYLQFDKAWREWVLANYKSR